MDVDAESDGPPLLYGSLSSWQALQLAPRHQVLLVDTRPSSAAAAGSSVALLVDESSTPWPAGGLHLLHRLFETNTTEGQSEASIASINDRLDVGVIPRLLRLAVREPELVVPVLRLLLCFVRASPEIAAELSRNHLPALWHLGKCGQPADVATACATSIEQACEQQVASVGDRAWQSEAPTEDPNWFVFGCRHYVIRFAAACCHVPRGGLPPPATARVAAFGRPGEGGVCDRVTSGPLRTGGRIWCSGLLLARELLARQLPALQGRSVLELGCGLGIAGIALAASGAGPQRCVLTDVEPEIVAAAEANLRYSAVPTSRGQALTLDMRNLDAVQALARDHDVSAVIGADLVYGALTAEEVAKAARAALPPGGIAFLLMPTKYRPGMDAKVFAESLTAAGFDVQGFFEVESRDAHAVFSVCEEGQAYFLYEAVASRDPRSS
eukprot:TRINITY_DN54635_c0_g1_i1.p1 TRINITY_DN54635_c0_g1~~TRINITY_DN54635_c0_g1_i1.p1  ORF type:complete len:440 (+),score=91.84 TRINITY_DN54635_c0_g1_i1:59-1378(+)